MFSIQIWLRPLYNSKENELNYAIVFISLRTDGAPHALSFKLSEIKLPKQAGYKMNDLIISALEKPRTVSVDTELTFIVNPSGKDTFFYFFYIHLSY